MKASKKTKAARAAEEQPQTVSILRLPRQSVPVARRQRSVAPFRIRVAAAQQDCTQCLAGCAGLPPPMRAFCESLCKAVCQG